MVPTGPWYKEFGSFKLCGEGKVSQDILTRGAGSHGQKTLAKRMRATRERARLQQDRHTCLEIFFFFMALASCQATTILDGLRLCFCEDVSLLQEVVIEHVPDIFRVGP